MSAVLAFACSLAQAGTSAEVSIGNYRFEPAQLTIRAGDSVIWINREQRTSHSILFSGPGAQESERLFPGEQWQKQFDLPGRYPYSCGPHPEMKGVVIVE